MPDFGCLVLIRYYGTAAIEFSFEDPILSSKLIRSFDSPHFRCIPMIALPSIQNNHFLMLTACLIFLGLVGCERPNPKSLPTLLEDNVEYELEGRVRRIWAADRFEFGEVNELHCIMIRGVNTPKPGQQYYDDAKAQLAKLVRQRIARISIVGRDSLMREFADVYSRPKIGSWNETGGWDETAQSGESPDAIEINVGLNLIQQGLGWYDRTEFEGADVYKQAELEAREAGIGLWAQDNPIPPWDFQEH